LTDLPVEVSGQAQAGSIGAPVPMPVGEAGTADVSNLARQLFQ
jgi:hypothetical protein